MARQKLVLETRIIMTKEERMKKAEFIYLAIEKRLTNLFERWQAEKEYEDFKDYEKVMKDMISLHDGIFIKGSKRPFGCIFILADATYQISVSYTKYSYKRIK